MAIAFYIILYFGLLALCATPLMYAGLFSALSVPVLFSSISTYSLSDIAADIMSGASGSNTSLTIIFFVMAGDLMSRGKLTEKIFNIFAYFLGKRRGFLPILAIGTCMFYGAISGSGPATTAAVGAMCFPILIGMGYDKLFSAAILVTAGCLGMVIPPSVPVTSISSVTGGLDLVVLYKLATIAGVVCGALMMVYCYVYCLRNGNGDQTKINQWVDNLRQRGLGRVFKESIWAMLTPVAILGSIFSGIADTAQAAVLSYVYAILVCVFIYKTVSFADIIKIAKKSICTSAGMLVMLAAMSAFGKGLTSLNLTEVLNSIASNSQISSVMVMLFLMIYMVIMGMVGTGTAPSMYMPIVYPLIIAVGIEPFTACIALVLLQAIGLVTPPVGLCLFVMTGMADCNVTELAKPLLPYILIMLLVAIVLAFCPGLFSGLVAGGYVPIP